MNPTAIIPDQIFRQLRILQHLTWLQTTALIVAGLGFLAPATGTNVQISLPNGIISYPAWLLGLAAFSTVYGIPALWWSYDQLDLRGFHYSRWVNWHAAVLTLFVLFVFILGPYNPGIVMFGAFAGALYGTISAIAISRTSLRLSQSNKGETTRGLQKTRQEALVSAQQD